MPGIRPEISITETAVIRTLDRQKLVRIFNNIISNAIKYGGKEFTVSLADNGEMIFSNRAEHIDEVTAGRLFDRFYTVESGHNSTGLGLSISKILCEQMGGIISAESMEGRLYIKLQFPKL